MKRNVKRVFINLVTIISFGLSITSYAEESLNKGLECLEGCILETGGYGERVDYIGGAFAVLGESACGEDMSDVKSGMVEWESRTCSDEIYKLLGTKDSSLIGSLITNCQQADGSFGTVYLSGLACVALAEAGVKNQSLNNYLLSIQNEDGSFGDGKELECSIILYGLMLSGLDNSEGYDWLLRAQEPGGDFGDVLSTAWSVLAVRERGGSLVERGKAVDWLVSMQNDDGGWSFSGGGGSEVHATGLVLWALAGLVESGGLSEGLEFLESRRSRTGLWLDVRDSIKTTSTVHDVLEEISMGAGLRRTAISYLQGAEPGNIEQDARLLGSLAFAGEEIGRGIEELASWQGEDGGWSLGEGYSSDAVTTARVLTALKRAGFYSGTLESRGIEYLRDTQNSDGSWGYKGVAGGTDAAAAEVVLALAEYAGRYDVSGIMSNAGSWLEGRQNADGSFGGGTAWETALALLAIYETDFNGDIARSAYEFLVSRQDASGCWEGDAYSTALAMFAIYRSKPNLEIKDADVLTSIDNPTIGDHLVITAKVRNKGAFPAQDILVRFYLGDPAEGGELLGEETIDSLSRKEENEVSVEWDVDVEPVGYKYVYVAADPEDLIDEANELDNVGIRDFEVSHRPDLVVTDSDLRTLPELPTPHETQLEIIARVHNAGGRDADNFRAGLYIDAPLQGDPLDSETISVPFGSETELSFKFSPVGGEHFYYVVADIDDQILEQNEDNNTGKVSIEVEERLDLAITNMLFSDENPKELDHIEVRAVVYNTFFSAAENVKVKFWLGEPDTGELIGEKIINYISPGRTGIASVIFDTEGRSGTNYIYAKVDPDNEIVEGDEYNNLFKGTLIVTSLPDLLLTRSEISFNSGYWIKTDEMTDIPIMHFEYSVPYVIHGDDIKIMVILSNQGTSSAKDVLVRFFIGHPNEGGMMLDLDRTVDEVLYRTGPQGGAWSSSTTSQYTSVVEVQYNTLNMELGSYELCVWLDAEEIINEWDDDNNLACADFEVVPRGDITVFADNIEFNPAHPEEGDTLQISAAIENIGFSIVKDFHVQFYDGDPRVSGQVINQVYVPMFLDEYCGQSIFDCFALKGTNPIDFREGPTQIEKSVEWNTLGKLGYHDIFVYSDPEEVVDEANEDNNIVYKRIEVVPASKPDFEISSDSLELVPESVASGTDMQVSAKVRNLRNHPAENVLVRFYRSHPELGTVQIGTDQIITDLAGLDSQTVSTTFDTTGVVGRVMVVAIADPLDQIEEKNEMNNRGEKEVLIKLPPDWFAGNLSVEIDQTTAYLNWDKAGFSEIEGHYVMRDGRMLDSGLREVAFGSEICASEFQDDNHAPGAAADRNYDTWWSIEKPAEEQWIELDIGRDYYLKAIVINWLDKGIVEDFSLVAWEKEEFIEIMKVKGNKDRNSVHYFDENIKTRKIRLVFPEQNLTSNYIGICEINLFAVKPME